MLSHLIPSLRTSITLLRYTLGLAYLWFGSLKLFEISPVEPLIRASYSFVPFEPFQMLIGLLEVFIGVGLVIGKKIPLFILLLWIQMGGVFTSVLLAPERFFQKGNIFALSLEGEFMVKNLILLGSSLVILSYLRENKSI